MHEKYIKRGEKIHGPYYYKSYRDSKGNVKKLYLGKNVSVKNTVTPQDSKRFTKGFYIAIFVLIAFVLLSVVLERPSITGKAVDDVVSFGILEPAVDETVIEENKSEEEIIDREVMDIQLLEEVQNKIVEKEDIYFEKQEIEFKAANDQAVCGNIGVAGEYYLINDVTNAATCFTFSVDDIILDCNGSTVTFGTGGGDSAYGFTGSNINNILIQNCPLVITDAGGDYNMAFNFDGITNLTIQNVSITTGSGGGYNRGIDIDNSVDINITDNIINQVSQTYATGISISGTNYTNITNNQITADDTMYNDGINIYDSYNTSIYNNFIELNGTLQEVPATFPYRGIYLGEISQFENLEYTEVVNNTIISYSPSGRGTGNSIGSGIYIDSSCNITMVENSINMTIADPLIIVGYASEEYNHSIDETNLINGLKIGFNYSVSDVTLFENVDLTETYGTLICAGCSNVVYDNVSINTAGIKLFEVSSSIVQNSAINASIGPALLVIPEVVLGVVGPCNVFNQYINNNIESTASNYGIAMEEECRIFIFNNSHGQIIWTFDNDYLYVSPPLSVGNGVNIEQNVVGLEELSGYDALNITSEIEIRNLDYTSTPYLYKITNDSETTVNSLRCDNDPTLCSISYDSGSGILYANVSSFSNYTTDIEPVASLTFSNALITLGGTETVTCSATDSGENIASVSLSGDSQSCNGVNSCSVSYQTLNDGQICFTCTATDTNNLQDVENSCFTVDIIHDGGGAAGSGASGEDTVEAPPAEIPAQEEQNTEEQQAEVEQEVQNTEEQQMTVNVDYIPQVLLQTVTVEVSEDHSEVSVNLDSQGTMKITLEKTKEGISKPRLDLNFKLEKTKITQREVEINQLPITLNLGLFTIAILI